MASESELRDAMRSSANIPGRGIDPAAVVRKARARRVPKQLAFSSLSVLAIAGIATLGITSLPSLQPGPDVASEFGVTAAEPQVPNQSDATLGESSKLFDARQLSSNLCGMPAASIEPNSAGLVLSVQFPAFASPDDHRVTGTVVLTNSGTLRARGTTAIEPVISLARAGTTVWHSNTALDTKGILIDLVPGESFSYDAEFTPVECEPEDDAGEQFRSDLPPLPTGDYLISAELDFIPDAAVPGESILIGGPPTNIELR